MLTLNDQQKENLLVAFLTIQAAHYGYTINEDTLLNSQHPRIIFIRNIAHKLIEELESI